MLNACATAVVAVAVSNMASQAEEGGRLLQQVVGNRAVRRMAVSRSSRSPADAHRRTGPCFSAWHFQHNKLSVSARRLPSIWPCASWQSPQNILPSFTGWCEGSENLAKTSEWHLKHTPGSLTDIGRRFGRATSKWLMPTTCGTLALACGRMAIRAGDSHDRVRRRVPGHDRRTRLMAIQAQLLP